MTASKIEKLIKDTFTAQELSNNHFYTAAKVPPLAILRISAQFQSLNLAKEEILFLYDANQAGNINRGFVLTDHNIHFYKGYMPLKQAKALFDDKGSLRPPFPNLPAEVREKLATFFRGIANYDAQGDTNLAKYGSKTLKDKMNETSNNNSSKDSSSITIDGVQSNKEITTEEAIAKDLIDKEFLQMLKHETDVYLDICELLDKDKLFKEAVQRMANDTNIVVNNPKAKELIAQDFIQIFDICSKIDQVKRREQFAMAYVFERLIGGGDMAQSIKLSRLNDMLENEKFQTNMDKLRGFKIFDVKGTFTDQLLVPSILAKLDHELMSEVGTHLYRFAQIVVKADGKVSKEEEETLKTVLEMVSKPKKALPNVKQMEFSDDESLDDVIAELNELIGLNNIKLDIKTLINFIKVQQAREEQGLATQSKSLHAVFMGPPGTGKTTIARLVAKIYKQMGVLKKGQLVETDRAGLVAGYIGQTAKKTDEVIQAALDGVLFIDEAYALSRGGEDKRDFGHEAIETLLKRMEDYRDRLIVIVAGYPDEMETFIKSNPGLQSRFNRYFTFNHYNGEELLNIFKLFAGKADFTLTEDAEEKLEFIFDELYEKRHRTFGNARTARNIFEKCIERQANRIVSITPLTKEVLMALTDEDIPEVNETIKDILVFDEKKEQELEGEQNPAAKAMQQLGAIMNPNGAAAEEGEK